MVKLVVTMVTVCLCLSQVSTGDVSKRTLKKIAKYHMMESCIGKVNAKELINRLKMSVKKCQHLTPTFDLNIFNDKSTNDLYRPSVDRFGLNNNNENKQNTDINFENPYEAWLAFLAFQQAQKVGTGRRFTRDIPSQEEIMKFTEDIRKFKIKKVDNIGNLTCVLADFGALDANLNINTNFFSRNFWNLLPEQVDEEFQKKYTEQCQDCHSIAQSMPQAVLDKHPLYKKFGRQMIFFKCEQKVRTNLCAKQEISRQMEEMFGPVSSSMLSSLGLPDDKFDAAYMAKKVKINATPESQKFVFNALLFQEEEM